MPTWRRTRFSSTPAPVTWCPSRLIRPLSMGSSRLMQRSSVDLPEPEAPIRQMTSWAATDRLMPLSTSLVPKDLCRSSIRMAWAAAGRGCARRLDLGAAHAVAPASRRRRSRSISRSVNRASGMVRIRNKIAATVKLE